MIARLTGIAAIAWLAACEHKVVDLGIDAVGMQAPDASLCRCRITQCRVPGDCALIGGACGADFFCVGDFGACSTAQQCQATVTNSVCTTATDTTAACE